jgi:hypothetical protein
LSSQNLTDFLNRIYWNILQRTTMIECHFNSHWRS